MADLNYNDPIWDNEKLMAQWTTGLIHRDEKMITDARDRILALPQDEINKLLASGVAAILAMRIMEKAKPKGRVQ